MSQTCFVRYRDRGFWAYDVALKIFLKHLIDVSQFRCVGADCVWLGEAVRSWRVSTILASDLGLTIDIDETWSTNEVSTFIELVEEACRRLADRDSIPAEEIKSWDILDGHGVFQRRATDGLTAPIVELGRAIIALVNETLPEPPTGTLWFFGTPTPDNTIRMRQ